MTATIMLKVLPDINIFAYMFATTSSNIQHRLRARLAQGLLAEPNTRLLLYEEQLEEIHRTLDDLVIRGVLTSSVKHDIVERIHIDMKQLVESCKAMNKCIIAPRDRSYVVRAAQLYRILEQHIGRAWTRRLGRISMDLKLLAVAEAHKATIITHDQNLYRVYKEALKDYTHIPSLYYLDIRADGIRYRVCGGTIPALEQLLDEAASTENMKREGTIEEC